MNIRFELTFVNIVLSIIIMLNGPSCFAQVLDVLIENISQKISPSDIHSDQAPKRLAARLQESHRLLEQRDVNRAALLVENYSAPTPENLEWPCVLGYVQAACLTAGKGSAHTFCA